MTKSQFFTFLLGLSILTSCTAPADDQIQLLYDSDIPQLVFTTPELENALEAAGWNLLDRKTRNSYSINFELEESLEAEAYRIEQLEKNISIQGGDANALMYAALDLTDRLRLGADLRQLETISAEPYIKKRGIKFNIPLDARTPSYDDTGDAAQKNIATMWEFEFWQNFLDKLARDRYNLLTLWSLHPYPSWVQVPDYPEVALDNVCAFTGNIHHKTDRNWEDMDIQNPDSLRVIKEMSMSEKINFWKRVFQHAADRGIEIYIFHWNVYVHGAEGKHDIKWAQDDSVTVDYIRKSVKEFLLTYPNIKGIGVTAGEFIDRDLEGEYSTENWMWHTYGQGIMDAKAENPDLDVRFIFRRHWSDLGDIVAAFEDFDGQIETSFKYSRARMYSSTDPPWFDSIYRADVEKHQFRSWLNVRNDDLFTFRWGDPLYARQYIRNMPVDVSPGFYMGPDGYVWGREFISKNSTEPRQYEIDKHWYRFKIWGQTAYNPYLPMSYFINQLRLRYPEVDAPLLFESWQASSDVISWIDKIHFRQNDFQFLPTGCLDVNGFHDVNSFIHFGAMPEQGVQSIADFAQGTGIGLDPFQVAKKLDEATQKLKKGADELDPGTDPDLQETLGDFRAMSHLGAYYADKVRGATFLAQYRLNGNPEDQTNAILALENALNHWLDYADAAAAQYLPQLMARTRTLDWEALIPFVAEDIEIARRAKKGESVGPAVDNRLWLRDRRRF